MILKLAFRNIKGAGLRTWLNVFVLSFAIVMIMFSRGAIEGMSEQIVTSMKDSEIGGGQIWHTKYDPYDPLTFADSHGKLLKPQLKLIKQDKAAAILIIQGSIYPNGRAQGLFVKGIDPNQKILNLPSLNIKTDNPDVIPALIGTRMSKQTGLKLNDTVTLRWRDINGSFDAAEIKIVHIMNTNVPAVDSGQIWVPIKNLQTMIQAENHVTMIVLDKNIKTAPDVANGWVFRDLEYLLKDLNNMIEMKKKSGIIMYMVLYGMALLAIFDTQVLAIFRRRKEIGTLMALGLERVKVITLFTVEGAIQGLLAFIIGAVYGIPLLGYTTIKGIPLPESTDDFGIPMGNTIYTSFGPQLLGVSLFVFFIAVVIVSYIPARKITKLNPTNALRGKMS